MTSIELYINKQLCDIENPDKFSVYLKRQLINPTELSVKDAQRSYDITLPATVVNNEIFGYMNTEEVRGKFSQLYDAQLLVNGVRIFDGKFKMSEISKTYYKGNLGIPAQKTVKEIFGDKMMNEAGKWLIGFKNIADITAYNKGTAKDADACFFPLVLYGLLPKDATEVKGNAVYTDKDVFDETVRLGFKHMPPSINCLKAIEQIFNSQDLKIGGSAFNDERLTKLYMSYKNPPEYPMPWNYGELATINIKGNWTNVRDGKVEAQYFTHEDNPNFVVVDLLNNSHMRLTEPLTDPGANVLSYVGELNGREVNHNIVSVPSSGLYKITLETTVTIDSALDLKVKDNGIIVASGRQIRLSGMDFYEYINDLNSSRFEVKLLRYKKDQQKDLTKDFGFDNEFYKDNIAQEYGEDIYPKYFPKPGDVNFIDVKQNEFLICGFSFNENIEKGTAGFNPANGEQLKNNILVKKCGVSWDHDIVDDKQFVVVNCPQYYKADIDEAGVITYELQSDRFSMSLTDTPFNNKIEKDNNNFRGTGKVCVVAWLDEGDKLVLTGNSDKGKVRKERPWIKHTIDFELSIDAFLKEKDEWLKVNGDWTGTGDMSWKTDTTFLTDNLDLVKFLPSKVKINDWLDNFCKAFNLNLVQTDQENFELNTRQIRSLNVVSVIDLDHKADVDVLRRNTSLFLPSVYQIGFTIDKQEQGYVESPAKDDGGGNYNTGSPELKIINQTSFFSYNWLKKIKNSIINEDLYLPVVSDKKVWENGVSDYQKMQEENYIDKAQRFWYKKTSTFPTILKKTIDVEAGLVATHINGENPMNLDYKDEPYSILNNYFTLLTDADNCYTTVECYLSPEEYNRIPDSMVKLNSDLYYVADIDGYDPLCKKKTTLRLIRRMQ